MLVKIVLFKKITNSWNSFNISLSMLSIRALISLFNFLVDSLFFFRIWILESMNKQYKLSNKGWCLRQVYNLLVDILLQNSKVLGVEEVLLEFLRINIVNLEHVFCEFFYKFFLKLRVHIFFNEIHNISFAFQANDFKYFLIENFRANLFLAFLFFALVNA